MVDFSKRITFKGFIQTVIILILFYVILGVFLKGGFGLQNGKPFFDLSFEFGQAFDAITFFTILVISVIAWMIINFIFEVPNIRNRKQFFILIAVGFLIFLGYVFVSQGDIIPAFQGSFLNYASHVIIPP